MKYDRIMIIFKILFILHILTQVIEKSNGHGAIDICSLVISMKILELTNECNIGFESAELLLLIQILY